MNKQSNQIKNTKIIAITSGKGGVGKSTISANLSFLIAEQNKKVAIFDADIGLANLDLMFGINIQHNILHALKGEKTLKDIIYQVEENLSLIPGDSGEEILKYASFDKVQNLLDQSDALDNFDYIVIDTGAGIGGVTQDFLNISDKIIVITTPDPAAISDAYATIKLNAKKDKEMFLLFNMVKNEKEAKSLFGKIYSVGQKHIENLKLEYLGYLPQHTIVKEAIKNRELFVKKQPMSIPSRALIGSAMNIMTNMEKDAVFKTETKTFKMLLERLLNLM